MFNDQVINGTYTVDGNDFIVYLKQIPTIGQLTINCRGKDIEIDAVRVINDDVNSILMDLQISTYLKEDIANIIFGDKSIQKKRIAIRKLKSKGLAKEHIKLFLKLLEYILKFSILTLIKVLNIGNSISKEISLKESLCVVKTNKITL